jgi:hypothetical protein
MNEHNRSRVIIAALLAAALGAGATAAAHPGHDEHATHFDAPQHGGVVLEFHDEIHYEVTVVKNGTELQVWLGDAHRRPLAAASEVTDLVAEVGHPGNKTDPVDMKVSNDGNYWVGAVHLKDPQDIVRIGFTYHQMVATSSTKYDTLLHPPKPPAEAPHGHDDHAHAQPGGQT